MSSLPAISIDPSIAAAGLRLTLGVIACRVRFDRDDGPLMATLSQVAGERAHGLGGRPAVEIPAIAATRKAYKALGKDPSRYRPSAEALLRRLAQGKALYRINAVVDTNNLISMATGLSCGVYRMEALTPPIVCRRGEAAESYAAIGRGPINLEGLPLLADAQGPFGSPTSDSERSMVTPETDRLLMVLFGFGDAGAMAEALDLAGGYLERFCAAQELETSQLPNR